MLALSLFLVMLTTFQAGSSVIELRGRFGTQNWTKLGFGSLPSSALVSASTELDCLY